MNKGRYLLIAVPGVAVIVVGLWFVIRGMSLPEANELPGPQRAGTPGTAAGMDLRPKSASAPAGTQDRDLSLRQPASERDGGGPPRPPDAVSQTPALVEQEIQATSVSVPEAARANDPSVARFTDASIPVEKRLAEVEQLGKDGSANAVQTLMKLGDTYTYLNHKAVEALGNIQTPEVAKYLAGKTTDKDPRIVSCAVLSLARVQGAEAVPAIADVVAANRHRPDGFQDTVCGACVKAMGEIGSPRAVPALAEEFEKTVGKTLQHEYGSQVVAALKAIRDPGGVPALEGYAARLRKEKDAMGDNPMGQRYLESRIKEVEDALAFIKVKDR